MSSNAAPRRDSSDSVYSDSSKTSSILLTTAPATQPTAADRKSRSVDPGSDQTNAGRASISVPPPRSWRQSLQQSARRPSVSLLESSALGKSPFAGLIRVASREGSVRPTSDDSDPSPSTPKPTPLTTYLRRSSNVDITALNPSVSVQQEFDRVEPNRLSFPSSILSLGSSIMNGNWAAPQSTASSMAGSDVGEGPIDIPLSTTAVSPVSVMASGQSGVIGSSPSHSLTNGDAAIDAILSPPPSTPQIMSPPQSLPPHRASTVSRQTRSRGPSRTLSAANLAGTSSPSSERSTQTEREGYLGIIGICALDSKARSKPSRNILNRINSKNEFEVIIFGDKVILDEEPENWPVCDYLIAFFSEGFPLQKAIEYVRLRKPFSVNDLPMQMVLWDRRLCLYILDKYQVRTPKRVEVSRDGGPKLESPELAQHLFEKTGVKLQGPEDGTGGGIPPPKEVIMLDEDTISVDGMRISKPFVEKPVSGEDHNIHIYYSSEVGGGGRRLFRKVNNKSSEADDCLNVPRCITDTTSSYVYESFLSTQNHEDVKAYTVGSDFCHVETRKSPVVDGIVKRNTHGKEIRYITSLSPEEASMASKIAAAFGQRICGFDLLRAEGKSYVIDVNGWSFVKDNNEYYDKCASILKELFMKEKFNKDMKSSALDSEGSGGSEPTSRHGAFSAFKSILKSPSMSRLAGHIHSSHHHSSGRGHGNASPDITQMTVPIVPAPSTEKIPILKLPHASHPELNPLLTQSPALDTSAEANKPIPPPAVKSQWKLKGMVAVIRHADRTPKQKIKFTFHTKPFVDLLKGHREEVLLVGEAALNSVLRAVKAALAERVEDPEKLRILRTALVKKGNWAGTKVQIKPMFRKKTVPVHNPETDVPSSPEMSKSTLEPSPKKPKEDQGLKADQKQAKLLQYRTNSVNDGVTLSRVAAEEENLELEKLQLIIKWGGEPTHSARYQSQELGENMRNDLLLMNRDSVEDLKVFSSSERRVTTSAQIWTAAFLNEQELPPDFIQIRKDLLDDSNAAKDEMDKVKKKLKGLLREGKKAPPQFAWPENMPEPFIVARNVVELMKFHRRVMRDNFSKLYGGAAASLAAAVKAPNPGAAAPATSLSLAHAINTIQPRWCSGEDAELFRERWEKLFNEFCEPDKVDPGKISELHDTIKFDALHNRQFLEWVFTPSQAVLDEFYPPESSRGTPGEEDVTFKPPPRSDTGKSNTEKPVEKANLAQRMGFRKRPAIDPTTLQQTANNPATESYFSLFTGGARAKDKANVRLEKLRELFMYSKILFDFIGPQEYGITDAEKLEIGLLTSLPLLRAIVSEMEDMKASPGAKTSVYFTKESHIYTLLNCIIEGGIETKIERNKIPELDYLSTICFELYEAQDGTDADGEVSFKYSIRITISPGCHTFEPLDVQLDSKHCIGFAQRRSLTAHNDYKQVLGTLRAKFHTVKLPKSFVAVNLSEKVPDAFEVGARNGMKIEGSEASEEGEGAGIGLGLGLGLLGGAGGALDGVGEGGGDGEVLGGEKEVLEGPWPGKDAI